MQYDISEKIMLCIKMLLNRKVKMYSSFYNLTPSPSLGNTILSDAHICCHVCISVHLNSCYLNTVITTYT